MTVAALFGGTSALKYKLGSGGKSCWRALLLEDEVYHPPDDGWADRVYTCTQPQLKTVKTETSSELTPVSTPAEVRQSSAVYSGPLPSSSLVSPFIAGLPPMAQIWGSGTGLNLGTQVSPGLGQSIFNNIGALGNIGAGYSGTAPGAHQHHFSKNN